MPGFEVARKLDKAGLRTSDTAELFFSDVRVPAENVLGQENQGFYQIMANFQPERLLIAIAAVAGSEYGLELTLDYVKERKQFGRTISSFQVVKHRFAEMATQNEAARELTYRACDMYNRGIDCTREVSMAKWFTTEVANTISYQCQQLFGGYGYMMEYPIQRGWRDGRIATVVGGTTEIMKELVARSYGL
jgi:acyl-CoA dehydrogenase